MKKISLSILVFLICIGMSFAADYSGTTTGVEIDWLHGKTDTIQIQPSEGAFADGDKSKLDGIETSADVTDATNVAAAGAVMDGDFSSNGLMQRSGAGTYTVFPISTMTDTKFCTYSTANGLVCDSSGTGAGINDLVDDTTPQLGGDLDVNGHAITGYLPSINEDNMASDSEAYVPTQQSVKAYVDGLVGAPNNITPVDTADENATFYAILVDGATGAQATETDAGLTYNPSSNALTAATFIGALTGNASGSAASITGDLDPDQLSGDTVDDNLIDQEIIAGMASSGSASPGFTAYDSDSPGSDKTAGFLGWQYVDGADGAENSDWLLQIMQAGSLATILAFDESDDQFETTKAINSSGGFVGDLTGTASAVTNATLTTALTVNTGAVTLAGNAGGSSQITIPNGTVTLAVGTMALDSHTVQYSATPVIDDPDNFAANFTGGNLYGGTFIANAAGTAALPDPAAGMNFTYVLEGANANIVDPLGTGTADTIVMNGLAAAQDENITSSTSGAICYFQYRAANSWMATCVDFAEATP